MRKKIMALIISACVAFSVAPVYASTVPDSEVSLAITVGSVIEEIGTITEEMSDKEIRTIYQDYLALSMSDRLQVSNANVLLDIVNARGLATANVPDVNGNTRESDKEDVKQGREYTFSGGVSLTLTIQYATAEDGSIIEPAVYLVAPDGTQTQMTSQNAKLSDDKKDISIFWEAAFVQFDIASVSEGQWTLITTSDVTFNKLEYVGGTTQFSSATEAETEETDVFVEADDSPENVNLAEFFPIILIGAIMLVLLIFKKKKPKVKKEKTTTSAVHRNSDYASSREKELEELKREWEEERAFYLEKPKEPVKEECKHETEEFAPVKEEEKEIQVTTSDIHDYHYPSTDLSVRMPDGFFPEDEL